MKSKSTEEMFLGKLDSLYQERILTLQTIQLKDLLTHNPYLHQLVCEGMAHLIVRKLLENHLGLQTSWLDLATNTEFLRYFKLIQRNDLKSRSKYESETVGAENRLALTFIKTFCTRTGAVNWRKLLRENAKVVTRSRQPLERFTL